MRKPYFNPEVAADFGISAAVIYQFISDACKADATPWTQLHDGRYWVVFPKRRFKDVFPYLSETTVYKTLRKLQNFGLIESACFDTYTKNILSYSPRPDDRFDDFD